MYINCTRVDCTEANYCTRKKNHAEIAVIDSEQLLQCASESLPYIRSITKREWYVYKT